MLKFSSLAAVLFLGLIHPAYADVIRPGGDGGGGRIGKVCISDFLSQPERDDCVAKMQAAKNNAERQEIRDLVREAVKARKKEAEIRRDNFNPGGPQR